MHRFSRYTRNDFQQLLKEQGVNCSLSLAAEAWDNSAIGYASPIDFEKAQQA
jgi:hypothetical protein